MSHFRRETRLGDPTPPGSQTPSRHVSTPRQRRSETPRRARPRPASTHARHPTRPAQIPPSQTSRRPAQRLTPDVTRHPGPAPRALAPRGVEPRPCRAWRDAPSRPPGDAAPLRETSRETSEVRSRARSHARSYARTHNARSHTRSHTRGIARARRAGKFSV